MTMFKVGYKLRHGRQCQQCQLCHKEFHPWDSDWAVQLWCEQCFKEHDRHFEKIKSIAEKKLFSQSLQSKEGVGDDNE